MEIDQKQTALVEREVNKIMALLPRHAVDREDLIGYGHLGFLEAQKRFDPTRGIPLEAFAVFRVRGAIYDGLKQLGHYGKSYQRLKRQMVADELSEFSASQDQKSVDHQNPSSHQNPDPHQASAPDQAQAQAQRTALAKVTYHQIRELAMLCVMDHLIPPSDSPEKDAIDQENRQDIQEAFGMLNDQQKELLTAVYDLNEEGDNSSIFAKREQVHRSTIMRRARTAIGELKTHYDQVLLNRQNTISNPNSMKSNGS